MSEGVQGITLTPEQLQDLLAGAIKAAIAPSPDAQMKADDLKKRTEDSRRSSLEAMEAVRKATENRQAGCDHKKENGKWATGGQVLGNGTALTICQHCQKAWYWKPAPEVAQQLLSGDLTLHQSAPPSRTIDTQAN